MVGSKKGKWSRRNQGEWRALLARFGASGLGVEAFCRHEGISVASLYRWRSLLNQGGDGGAGNGDDTAPAFVDVGTLNGVPSARPRLELKLDLGDGLIPHLVRS